MLKLPVPSGATHLLVLKLPVSLVQHVFWCWNCQFHLVQHISWCWSCQFHLVQLEAASSIWCNTSLGVEAASSIWCNTPFGVETAGSYPGATRLQQVLPLLSSFRTRVESLPILGLGLSTALSPYTWCKLLYIVCEAWSAFPVFVFVETASTSPGARILRTGPTPVPSREQGSPSSPFSECSVLSQ